MLGAAIAAYAVVTMIESAGEIAVSKLLAPDPLVHAVISLVVGLSAMVLGGYVAVWIRRGAAAALAAIVAVIVIGLMTTMGDNVPLWYQVGFLIFGPLASLFGGALLRRQET